MKNNLLVKLLAKSFEEFGQFSTDFNEHVQTDLYQSHLVVTITFEIQNLLNNTQYSKRLNLIFVDAKNIENIDRFVRQFKMVLNKEKIITTKDKMVERLEQYLKGVHRFLMIGELPNLIKKGHRAQDEYMNLRNILDLMIKIKK